MKRVIFALATSLILCQSGYALLPPLYQTVDEIKAILESKELDQKLGSGDVIMTIQKNDTGYEITTNKRRLQIDVHYVPNQQPGPAQLQFHFHSPKEFR